MTTAEERMKILDMIRDKKITAEEGAQLLQALQEGTRRGEKDKGRDPRWLRVRVTDLRTNKAKVNVNVPMSLVNVGVKLGARFIPADGEMDVAGILENIRRGQIGKVFEFEDTNDGERVEIWVE
jgi:hypothetical protein